MRRRLVTPLRPVTPRPLARQPLRVRMRLLAMQLRQPLAMRRVRL